MSASRGTRNRGGQDRFYCPPAMRRLQQQQQQRLQPKNKSSKPISKASSTDAEKRIESDDCASSTTAPSASSSIPTSRASNLTNLDSFLEHTTPSVPAQYISKTIMRGWRTPELKWNPFFILGDLWESFKEWSAYGAGAPLVLNGSDSVVQYYVPYLSAIQLYIEPSKPARRLRRPAEESDADSSRETSTEGSSEYGVEREGNNVQGGWSQHVRGNAVMELSSDESDVTNPPGLLIFEYLEQDSPYGREPLADKIAVLASQFPKLLQVGFLWLGIPFTEYQWVQHYRTWMPAS